MPTRRQPAKRGAMDYAAPIAVPPWWPMLIPLRCSGSISSLLGGLLRRLGSLLRRLAVRIAVPSDAQATSQGVQCGSGPGATANAEVKGEVGNDHVDMTTRAGSPGKIFGCCQHWHCLLSRWRPTESDVLNKLGISSCGQEVMCLMPTEGSPQETKHEIHHHASALVYCNWLHNLFENYLQRCSAQYAITLSGRGSEWPRIQYGEIAVWYIRSAVAWQSVNRQTRNIGSELPMLQDVRRLLQACLPEFRMAKWCNRHYDVNVVDFVVRAVEALLWFRPSSHITGRHRPRQLPSKKHIISETFDRGGKLQSVSLGMVSYIHKNWCRTWEAKAEPRGKRTRRAFALAFCDAEIRLRRRDLPRWFRASSEPRVEHLRSLSRHGSRKGSRSAPPRVRVGLGYLGPRGARI